MIGLGSEIREVGEFNRRAAIALRGVSYRPESRELAFSKAVIASVDAGRALDKDQQQKLYNHVHRYRRQITDHLVLEFAPTYAKGAD